MVFLDQVCGDLGRLDANCQMEAKGYGNRIFSAISGQTPPDQVCAAIYLCPSSARQQQSEQQVNELLVSQPSVVETGFACLICEVLLEQIEDEDANATLAQVTQDLEKGCLKIPSLAKQCDAFIELFANDVWQAVTGEIPAGEICNTINVCHNATSYVLPQSFFNKATSVRPKHEQGGSKECLICTVLLQDVVAKTPKNFTEQQLFTAFEDMCASLGMFANDCDMLAMQFSNKIYNAITGDVPPEQVCENMHICKSPVTELQTDSQSAANAACTICELAVGKIADNNHNMTLGQVEETLLNACFDLPWLTHECNAFVELFSDEIWEAITGGIPPSKVCDFLQICHNATLSSSSSTAPVLHAVAASSPPPLVCHLCEYLLSDLTSHVPQNLTWAGLDTLLDQDCTGLGVLEEQCEAFVTLYGLDVYNALMGNIPAWDICEAISLCSGI